MTNAFREEPANNWNAFIVVRIAFSLSLRPGLKTLCIPVVQLIRSADNVVFSEQVAQDMINGKTKT